MFYFSSGDAGFYFQEQLRQLSWLPKIWHGEMGYGVSSLFRLWFDYPYQLLVKILSTFGLSWFVIDKFIWIAIISMLVYGSYRLARYVIGDSFSAILSTIIYSTNSYILLLLSGGQVGVSAAYAISPFVLYRFMKSVDEHATVKQSLIDGVWFAILIACDLRLTYIMVGAIALYMLIKRKLPVGAIGISGLVAIAFHAFWILPTVLSHANPGSIGEDFTNPGMLKFLSVADFSHAIALLHPNWPENLFGKVYFLQPEFLALPAVAFFALFFIQKSKRKLSVLFFALLALIGAFLAKGVNDPFGGIFNWCFSHIPGFVMFRDPTKFYLLTALGYAILIPFSVENITKNIRHRWIMPALMLLFWFFTIRAVFSGQVRGNFYPLRLPEEYEMLKDMLVQDAIPSRIVFIPEWEKFAYTSETHPFLTLRQVFPDTDTASVSAIATDSAFLQTLTTTGVRYVVVPMDVEGKLFMKEYRHDEAMRQDAILALQKSPLQKLPEYRNLAVFENPQFSGTSMTMPPVIVVQERYAGIGVGIGVVALIMIGIYLWL